MKEEVNILVVSKRTQARVKAEIELILSQDA